MRLEGFVPGVPGKGMIQVAVRAASVNPLDFKVRSGAFRLVTGWRFPRAMGTDFSGVVSAAGPGVGSFRVGDAVLGTTAVRDGGAFGDSVIVAAVRVVPKPEALSFEHAAALPVAGATAWTALVEKAGPRAGQSVFVNGCLGAVGRAAVGLAGMLGASVAGSCSEAGLVEAGALGVGLAFDYRALDPGALKGRFDVVFDTHGTLSLRDGRRMLRPGGVMLDIAPSVLKLVGILLSRRNRMVMADVSARVLAKVVDAAVAGPMLPWVGATVALAEAVPALSALELAGVPKGKLVIVMG